MENYHQVQLWDSRAWTRRDRSREREGDLHAHKISRRCLWRRRQAPPRWQRIGSGRHCPAQWCWSRTCCPWRSESSSACTATCSSPKTNSDQNPIPNYESQFPALSYLIKETKNTNGMNRIGREIDSGVDAEAAVVPAFLARTEGESRGSGNRENSSARPRLWNRAHETTDA